MTHGSLFSGIGGFDLAAGWAGWENKFHCEWNEFGQRVLKYYWPDAVSYGDITKTDFTIWRGRIDVLTGGFPCQPYSVAGKRKGKEDERHLWPEMLRAIQEIQPRYIVGENVPGLINWNGGMVFEEVQADLEAEGYEVIPFILPAASVNAPHKRERVWFIAHRANTRTENVQSRENGVYKYGITSNSTGQLQQGSESRKCGTKGQEVVQQKYRLTNTEQPRTMGKNGNASNTSSARREKFDLPGFSNGSRYGTRGNNADRTDWENFPTQPPICNGDDGLSTRLDGITFPKFRNESIKAGGNAIVPQVAYQIFKAINEFELNFNTNK